MIGPDPAGAGILEVCGSVWKYVGGPGRLLAL